MQRNCSSYSLLRLLKTYLRNRITEGRLNYLAMMYIYDTEPIDVDRVIERFASMKNRRLLLWFNRLNSDFSGYITLGARASCDRSEDTTRRLWSHEHPASLSWVQYLNSFCDWSKFMWVFSSVNRLSSVNQWKGSHKFKPITNRVQTLNSPKWGWKVVWPEPRLWHPWYG